MTRINSAIPPCELCDKHLVAEYRELPRVSTLAWNRFNKYSGLPPRGPSEFTLGTGHVLFFTYLGGFCSRRFASLVDEMKARGFSPAFTDYRPHPDGMNLDHTPTAIEHQLLAARIALRMPKNARYTKK